MKKLLLLSVFLFVFVSAAFAAHPLIGKWRFREVIGGVGFYDYVTITTVSTTTRKVSGYDTHYPSYKLTGYYNGNIVFIMDSSEDIYTDGYYFTFQGTIPFKKHLGICSIFSEFDANWHSLSATKLSNSITSVETMTLNNVLNQNILKVQAQLRENITAQTLIK